MLAAVVIIYLVLGCFFDGLSLMIMTLPIVVPLMVGLGYDAIWLGVIITVMIEIGQVTPPVGLNLSVLVSVTKEKVSLGEAAMAANITMPRGITRSFNISPSIPPEKNSYRNPFSFAPCSGLSKWRSASGIYLWVKQPRAVSTSTSGYWLAIESSGVAT